MYAYTYTEKFMYVCTYMDVIPGNFLFKVLL